MPRRSSPQTAALLQAMAADPTRWRYGYELGQEIALKAGSLYPILMRLSERDLLESTWEAAPPPGRPARHLYRLTAAGLRLAADTASAAASAAESRAGARGDRKETVAPRRTRSAW